MATGRPRLKTVRIAHLSCSFRLLLLKVRLIRETKHMFVCTSSEPLLAGAAALPSSTANFNLAPRGDERSEWLVLHARPRRRRLFRACGTSLAPCRAPPSPRGRSPRRRGSGPTPPRGGGHPGLAGGAGAVAVRGARAAAAHAARQRALDRLRGRAPHVGADGHGQMARRDRVRARLLGGSDHPFVVFEANLVATRSMIACRLSYSSRLPPRGASPIPARPISPRSCCARGASRVSRRVAPRRCPPSSCPRACHRVTRGRRTTTYRRFFVLPRASSCEVGVELHHGPGRNNGTVQGVRYFETSLNRLSGIFVRPSNCRALEPPQPPPQPHHPYVPPPPPQHEAFAAAANTAAPASAHAPADGQYAWRGAGDGAAVQPPPLSQHHHATATAVVPQSERERSLLAAVHDAYDPQGQQAQRGASAAAAAAAFAHGAEAALALLPGPGGWGRAPPPYAAPPSDADPTATATGPRGTAGGGGRDGGAAARAAGNKAAGAGPAAAGGLAVEHRLEAMDEKLITLGSVMAHIQVSRARPPR